MWELDYKENWAQKNWWFWTVVLEKTLESPLDCKEIQSVKKSVLNIHWKDWCWSWNSNTLATWCEELTHWKRPWCWERLKAGREGDNRGWDGWMASLTRWMSLSKLQELVMDREARRATVHGATKSWTWLSDWTELRGQELWGRVSFIPFVNSACAVSASHSPFGNLGMYWHLCLSGNGDRQSPNGLLLKYQFQIVQKTKRTKNQPQSQNPEILESTKCNTVESTKSYIVESTKS